MKRMLIVIYLFFSFFNLYATIIVQGNSTTAPFGFTVPITVTAYNPFFDTFFVGLNGSGDTFNISSVTGTTFLTATQLPKFSAVLQSTSGLKNLPIEFLTIQNSTATLPVLGVVLNSNGIFLNDTIFGLFTNGAQETQTPALNDAAGMPSAGITAIAAGGPVIFAAVRPNNAANNFGAANSGIAVVGVASQITATSQTLTLNVRNAATGLPGNQAVELDLNSVVLTGGTNPVVFQGGDATNITPLFWDDPLARLYIGTQITTGAAPGDIAKSVVVGNLLPGDALSLLPIAPNSAIDPTQEEIVVTENNGMAQSLSAIKLSVLHASTGPDYLIVYGGNGTFDTATSGVWALPLVNFPQNPAIQGTLANKNSPLVNFKFVTPAMNIGDLVNITDPAAQVGGQPLSLALQPGQQITQLTAQGDAVYVSIDLAPSPTNETGLFVSEALFGPDGKIVNWTPWTRALAFNAFSNTQLPGNVSYNGAVAGFGIDNKTGNIIFVDGTTDQVVGVTNFSTGILPNDLPSEINKQLPQGSYSVLDLDQATRGFLSTTSSRYALFGGTNTVIFTRTSIAFDDTISNSPQQVITDFANPANFLATTLPAPGGDVTVLEYSRTLSTQGNTNYFFAGTQNGLYVYAQQNGDGFFASQFGALNQPPFDTAHWFHITTIPGAIIDIKTTGNGNLYVLAFSTSATKPLQSTLYSIPFKTNISAMFAPSNISIIAQTGVGIFSNSLLFNGIQLVATNQVDGATPASKEQLVLATSQGLFVSNANQNPGNGITDATNQTQANFQFIQGTQTEFFNGVAGVNTPIRTTVFPFDVIDDFRGCKIFNNGAINQLSVDGNVGGTMAQIGNFVPANFIAQTNPPLLSPITYFYTDGSRRFFIFKLPQDGPTVNSLGILPFNNQQFNMTMPTILSPTPFNNQRYYWVSLIGDTGYLMAGTGSGVTALS